MVKTAEQKKKLAEKQRVFRELHGKRFKRLDMLLPIAEFDLLSDSAKDAGLTKVAYVISLLHGSGVNSITVENTTLSDTEPTTPNLLPVEADNSRESLTRCTALTAKKHQCKKTNNLVAYGEGDALCKVHAKKARQASGRIPTINRKQK